MAGGAPPPSAIKATVPALFASTSDLDRRLPRRARQCRPRSKKRGRTSISFRGQARKLRPSCPGPGERYERSIFHLASPTRASLCRSADCAEFRQGLRGRHPLGAAPAPSAQGHRQARSRCVALCRCLPRVARPPCRPHRLGLPGGRNHSPSERNHPTGPQN